jgi:two-component system, NtrC family, response regulator AtoC
MRKRPLVFIVDDDVIILKLIEAELNNLRLDIMSFRYGEECLKEFYLNPDLIILDYIFVKGSIKVLSGLEILLEIRKLNENVPVILLSGQESGSAVLELIKLGIEEYLIKEGNFTSKLKEVVLNVLQNNNSWE